MAEGFVALPKELLELATPSELHRYNQDLRLYKALRSPLDYACMVSKGTKRYPAVELVNKYVTALCEGRLYDDGPGPDAEWFWMDKDSNLHSLPEGFRSEWPSGAEGVVGLHPDDHSKVVRFRLAIQEPPRHGKSYLISEHLPGWFSARWPNLRGAFATYSDDFASEWGGKVRDQVVAAKIVEIKDGKNAPRAKFEIKDHAGGWRFVGAGGAITGSGFHIGVIDDPIKNAAQALSKPERDAIDNFYGSTWTTRKEPWAIEIMMFTPWHEDDLAGRRVFDGNGGTKDGWVSLKLPALCVDPDNDPLGRKKGEALVPERYPATALRKLQNDDPMWFEALYQLNPHLEDGGIFRRPFTYYTATDDSITGFMANGDQITLSSKECVHFATVDTAATKKTYSDFSVFMHFAFHREKQILIVRNIFREKMESIDLANWVKGLMADTGVSYVAVEPKTYGLQLTQQLLRDGVPVVKLTVDSDKVSRAMPAGPRASSGKIWFPKTAVWLGAFESELLLFPNGKHDDQVDCLAYGMVHTLLYPEMPETSPEPDPRSLPIHEQILRSLDTPDIPKLPGGV